MSARILVAEDDPAILRLVAFTLRRRGHTVLEASDGTSALALIRQELPDLIVLDVLMPGLSGLEIIPLLAQDPKTAGIPILILTASAQESEIQAGLASGAASYMTKPFEPRALGERVAELLEKSRPRA